MNAPKTFFVNGRFLTQPISGVQRYARELLRALHELLTSGAIDPRLYRVVILHPRKRVVGEDFGHIEGRPVGNFTGQFWEQAELPAHCRGALLLNLCNTAPLFKRNQVITIHDAATRAVPNSYTRAFRAWYRVMHSLVGTRAVRIITVSQFSKRELRDQLGLPEERIAVAPGGSDHILRARSDTFVLDRFDLRRRPFVLAVSSLSPHKNLLAVVEAIKLGGVSDVDFVIAGDSNRKVFEATALPAAIKRVGAVSDNELRALYEHAVCFVFPSLYEGFGLPPLEAMACGCPVLASRAASLPEVCGDAALYCDPLSAHDIAAKLQELLGSAELRKRLRDRGRARAALFTWRQCAHEVCQQILFVLGETCAPDNAWPPSLKEGTYE
jgi:glycosyltransferase involved in cell wall biosynthesis